MTWIWHSKTRPTVFLLRRTVTFELSAQSSLYLFPPSLFEQFGFFIPVSNTASFCFAKTCFSFRCQKTCSRLRLTQSVEIPSENKVAWIFAITAHIVVSAECRVILQWKWEQNLGTQAGVHVIERVRLIWGPLNTSFTVVVLSNRNRR